MPLPLRPFCIAHNKSCLVLSFSCNIRLHLVVGNEFGGSLRLPEGGFLTYLYFLHLIRLPQGHLLQVTSRNKLYRRPQIEGIVDCPLSFNAAVERNDEKASMNV